MHDSQAQFRRTTIHISILVAALTLGACGGGSDSGFDAVNLSTQPASTTQPSTTPTPAPSPTTTPTPAPTPTSTPTPTPTSTPSATEFTQSSVAMANPAPTSSLSLFNLEGYAQSANVTGGGVIAETSTNYCKVSNATEFTAAINNIKSTAKTPCKVIEITADLNLGWNEIGAANQTGNMTTNNPSNLPATTLTTMRAAGTSLINIQAFSGLTIFSKNGATIRHAEFNIKNGGNIILRNLKFAEMWEWDELTKGNYDKNDWDFITTGDGGGVVNGVWIDHCTFTKAYDGITDIKGASSVTGGTTGVTVSWSEIVPEDPVFMQHEFDAIEADRANNPMYDYLRKAGFSEDDIIRVATPQKKNSLVGALDLKESSVYTVTLHHDYFKNLQDRMPRLRSGDVHIYNLYADSSDNLLTKVWRDNIVTQNAQLSKDLDGNGGTQKYHFEIISNGSISTEGGSMEIAKSAYIGVLTPLRNNQSDPSNPAYTGAIRAFDVMHSLLASQMPVASQQSTYTDTLGNVWATWEGNSHGANSTLGPNQAPEIAFAWHNGTPTYTAHMHEVSQLKDLLSGPNSKAGAGRITMTTAQWLSPTN
ncbi:pectate lyase family protein [Silvimonas amylolytica]|nr:hypothetical protein [Silvimonas amylolytica]